MRRETLAFSMFLLAGFVPGFCTDGDCRPFEISADTCGGRLSFTVDCSAFEPDQLWHPSLSDCPNVAPGEAMRIVRGALIESKLLPENSSVHRVSLVPCASGWVYSVGVSGLQHCEGREEPDFVTAAAVVLMDGKVLSPLGLVAKEGAASIDTGGQQ
jgi:hypothetical protein